MRFIVRSYLDCTRCGLCRYRRNIVFGRGSVPADILFIGEAPGRSEDLLGQPFIGPSGRLLDAALVDAERRAGCSARYFITNVVACRPCDSQQGENRPPSQEEAVACAARLEETKRYIRPKETVFIGKVAERFCGKAFKPHSSVPHPAYVLRSGGVNSPMYRILVQGLVDVFTRVSRKEGVRV